MMRLPSKSCGRTASHCARGVVAAHEHAPYVGDGQFENLAINVAGELKLDDKIEETVFETVIKIGACATEQVKLDKRMLFLASVHRAQHDAHSVRFAAPDIHIARNRLLGLHKFRRSLIGKRHDGARIIAKPNAVIGKLHAF